MKFFYKPLLVALIYAVPALSSAGSTTFPTVNAAGNGQNSTPITAFQVPNNIPAADLPTPGGNAVSITAAIQSYAASQTTPTAAQPTCPEPPSSGQYKLNQYYWPTVAQSIAWWRGKPVFRPLDHTAICLALNTHTRIKRGGPGVAPQIRNHLAAPGLGGQDILGQGNTRVGPAPANIRRSRHVRAQATSIPTLGTARPGRAVAHTWLHHIVLRDIGIPIPGRAPNGRGPALDRHSRAARRGIGVNTLGAVRPGGLISATSLHNQAVLRVMAGLMDGTDQRGSIIALHRLRRRRHFA